MSSTPVEHRELVAPNGMRLSFVSVSPATATAWLTNNSANRRIRTAAVDAYASDMAADLWRTIPHAICFGENNELLNGQHTLTALVKAKKTLWLLVAKNVPAEVVAVMDSGRIRTIADQLKMVGDGSDKRAIQLARYVSSGLQTFNHSKGMLMSFNSALAAYDEHRDAIDFALSFTQGNNRVKGWSTAFLTVISRAFYSADHRELTRFMEILRTGIPLDICDSAALKLRDYMLSAQHAGSAQQKELYEKSQAALRAFLDRRIIQRLTGAPSELFHIPS